MRVLVIGASQMKGTARESGNKYDMLRIHVAAEQNVVDNANRTLNPIGLNPVALDMTQDAFDHLESQKLKFPIMMDLTEQTNLSSGRAIMEITNCKPVVASTGLPKT